MIVSIVGYANSGKTTLAVALARAAVEQGYTVAAIKTGHHGPDEARGDRRSKTMPDSSRLANAGAHPSLFWGPGGVIREGDAGVIADAPLPPRETFGASWQSLLPAAVAEGLVGTDLLIIEGRTVPEAQTVMMRDGEAGKLKYPEYAARWIVATPAEHSKLVRTIIENLGREKYMPGKPTTKRRPRDRKIQLVVDGAEVKLNGFVKDVFQETVVGIVRALGTVDESKSIELIISEAPE